MPFFIRNKATKASGEKRKRGSKIKDQKSNKKSTKNSQISNGKDEVISSDAESSEREEYAESFSSDEETEQEKKLRLTKKYLEQIENEERQKKEIDDTKDAIAQRLKDEALEEVGQLQKKRAHEFEYAVPEVHCILRGHKLSVTCVVISSCEKFLFSGSKDGSLIKWDIEEKRKLKTIPKQIKSTEGNFSGHTDHILALALSSDDKFLASGCRGKLIHIWNPESMELLKTFRGHKSAITGLVFQRGSHQLISASNDRSLKLWNLDEMGYVETLFGHQDSVASIDCFNGGNALTCGGRDNTVRIWKIVEESQLVFQGLGASIDCVCVSSHQNFVSGSDDGSLLLWGVQKKKPLNKVLKAHGHDPETEEPSWIVSLCSLRNTDLIVSGSKDGFIRLWKRDDDSHCLAPITSIPVKGFVNSLQFSQTGKFLIAGIGQEHRLGRWWKIKDCKNSILIYCWPNKQ